MRCYQEIGLREEAYGWLNDNCEKEVADLCSHCGKYNSERLKVLSEEHEDSFYGDGPTLHTYRLKSGGWVKEIVQAEPWSSGPCAFFCLLLDSGERLFEWSQEEIDNA